MCSEYKRLEQEIHKLNEKIRELPEGKLLCAKDRKNIKWYHSDGHKSKCISKKDRKFAEQLAVKKYFNYQLEELLKEQRAIGFYLRHHALEESKAEKLLDDKSPYAELLLPHFRPISEELCEWMKQPYEMNYIYPEQCIHKTIAGISVRSKSEALIATLLYTYKIPFRYECALQLEEMTVYPDFTIRHPKSGEIFYWEHFGMLDNCGYSKGAFSKMQLYTANEIFPSVQLLTTFETKEYPLDTEVVEKMIQHYFL